MDQGSRVKRKTRTLSPARSFGCGQVFCALSAGAGLYLNDKAESFAAGVALAGALVDSGKAMAALEKLIEVSNRPEEEA